MAGAEALDMCDSLLIFWIGIELSLSVEVAGIEGHGCLLMITEGFD